MKLKYRIHARFSNLILVTCRLRLSFTLMIMSRIIILDTTINLTVTAGANAQHPRSRGSERTMPKQRMLTTRNTLLMEENANCHPDICTGVDWEVKYPERDDHSNNSLGHLQLRSVGETSLWRGINSLRGGLIKNPCGGD